MELVKGFKQLQKTAYEMPTKTFKENQIDEGNRMLVSMNNLKKRSKIRTKTKHKFPVITSQNQKRNPYLT